MQTLVAYPQNEAQDKALRAVMEALNVPYDEEPDTSDSPYTPEFNEKMKQAEESIRDGKGTVYTMEEFQALCK